MIYQPWISSNISQEQRLEMMTNELFIRNELGIRQEQWWGMISNEISTIVEDSLSYADHSHHRGLIYNSMKLSNQHYRKTMTGRVP